MTVDKLIISVPNSHGLVDFAVGQVNFVPNMPNYQVKFAGGI